MVPDIESLVICPWQPKYAWMFADLYLDGAPYAVCPRGALKRQVEKAQKAGFAFYAGIEPEFIVMRTGPNGKPTKAFEDTSVSAAGVPLRRQAFGYDAEYSLDALPFLTEVAVMLDELGWGLTNLVAEGAQSQFELDFGYADVLRTADRFVLLRVLLKEVAKRHDLYVTFMAKPTQGDWRSGAHINHSFEAFDQPGVNLLNADGEWADRTYQVLGGLMEHAGALTALSCSTVNSYKGLIAEARGFEGGTATWAPTHVAYGMNNRSAMFRLPQARWAIENRAADMCMNPYLALAMTVGASLEGLETNADPGAPINTSLYDIGESELHEAGVEPLPTTLREAVLAFSADTLAVDVLGETMHDSYRRYKEDEWERFHEQVTDWEQVEYLRFF